jgi:hypothetical protein
MQTHPCRCCACRADYATGGTKNDSWIVLSVSFVFCQVLLFLAVTLKMNTLLPTAVAATRLWGFNSLHTPHNNSTQAVTCVTLQQAAAEGYGSKQRRCQPRCAADGGSGSMAHMQ